MSDQPDCILKVFAELDEIRERVAAMAPAARVAEEVLAKFTDLPEPRVYIGWQSGSIQGVLAMVGGWGDNAIKDARLIFPVLKEFSRRGFRLKGEPEDYAEIGRRTWELREASATTPILLSAFFPTPTLSAEGASCRFEQVGVKEAPVYKLVCDPPAEEAGE